MLSRMARSAWTGGEGGVAVVTVRACLPFDLLIYMCLV